MRWTGGLWDDADGLYYDRLTPSGEAVPIKVRSMVGIIPPWRPSSSPRMTASSAEVGKGFLVPGQPRHGGPEKLSESGRCAGARPAALLLSLCGPERVERLLTKLFDENEFLSAHGLRALSAYHREHPFTLEVEGITASIDYEPAESTTTMFGGNSNWRGPVWFPLNYLVFSV